MASLSQTRTTVAATILVALSAAPAFAQSVSSTGGGVQTTSKTTPGDQQLAQRVYDKLNSDQVDYFKHVTVLADRGTVTLGGTVPTTDALHRAKKLAGDVPGVIKVVDQMELSRAPTHPAGQ